MARRTDGQLALLHGANRDRSSVGARRQVADAQAALDVLEWATPLTNRETKAWARQLPVLRARVANPQFTLCELAASLGMTKNACWRLLVRGIKSGDVARIRGVLEDAS